MLSIVDNVQQEIERIEEEQDSIGYSTDYPTNRIIDESEGTVDDIGGSGE